MGIFGDILEGVANVGTLGTYGVAKDVLNGQNLGQSLGKNYGSYLTMGPVGGTIVNGRGVLKGATGGGAQPQQPQMGGPGSYMGWPVPPAGQMGGQQNFRGDLSGPGTGESYYTQNQGAWGKPSNAQGYWNQAGPGSNEASKYWEGVQGATRTGPPKSTNWAQQQYQQFSGSQPADMSSYYDNAVRRGSEDIQRAYGATGSYGSTRSMDAQAENSMNLRAQQAKDQAQYDLSRGALGGQLAGQADNSSRANISSDLGWLQGLGGLAMGVDQNNLQRQLGLGNLALGVDQGNLASLMGGMNASATAQQLLAQRGQNDFNNNLALGQQQAGALGNAYQSSIMNDQALLQAQLDLMLGGRREGLNQVAAGRASSEEGIGNLFGLLGSMSGTGGLGG